MSGGRTMTGIAALMRSEFDAAFAKPVREAAQPTEDLIGFRVRGSAYCMRLGEMDGVTAAESVVRLPTRASALLGLTNIRGVMVPIYSLSILLGFAAASEPARWLAVCGGRDPLALSLGMFDAHLRVKSEEIHAAQERRAHVHQFARIGGVVREIVDVASVIAAIRKTTASAIPSGG